MFRRDHLAIALSVGFVVSSTARAQSATATRPAAKPSVRAPPPKPLSDEDKASGFMKKHQYDLACPIYDKLTKASPDNVTDWAELGDCELHRGHKKTAIDAIAHAAASTDRTQRKLSYLALQEAGEKVDLPPKGCVWLPEGPGGCEEQMWACGYDWTQPDAQSTSGGHAITFGSADDERETLETALREGSALRPQLAAEWKALMNLRVDEQESGPCNNAALGSADGLVNARASACFQQKTGRVQPSDVCAQEDADCNVLTQCLDDAATLARRADSEHNRALWPEAYDVVAAAHRVCDATGGILSTTRCSVVWVNACAGLVGYTCVQTRRGRHPTTRVGEISINDGAANWSEAIAPAPAEKVETPPVKP